MSLLDQFDQLQEITPSEKWRAGIISKIKKERKNENNQFKSFILKFAACLIITINLYALYIHTSRRNDELIRGDMKTISAELFIPIH
ncbi:MAG: hypothetical protein JNK69_04295 [Saprospiraceae bacterium]|nr:hypothetical protein [Candidatus Vicinibacter proximus]MBL7822608.1 hypothetical protein [Saprospiraceae bacterium]MCC6842366.1 hypothetical protein [Saprospiraceae bacterium]